MSASKSIRPEATVKARMHQLESAVASAEHLSKHPDQLRKRQKGVLHHESDSDEGDATNDFAEFLQNLTLGATSRSNEKDALKQAFKILDCDQDGFITLSDLRKAMQDFDDDDDDNDDEDKLSDDDLLDMLTAADYHGTGRISFENFVRILEPKKSKVNENEPNKTKS